jgi:hypothetical protein
MISLSRRQARRLRAVFRRRILGIAHRGAVPPLRLRAEPDGLRVRHLLHHLALEHTLPRATRQEATLLLPLEALADFEGRDDSPVVLEPAAPGRTVARWHDRGIPQTREYAVGDPDSLPAFPDSPASFATCPAELLGALAEAAATTAADTRRYALDCLQLRGGTSEVVATDGHQILVRRGFRLPWDGDLLVRGTPLFASRELPRDRPLEVGRTDGHVVLRAGPWAVYLAIRTDARFPRVDGVVPAADRPATRLRLDPQDAAFLADALERLPGGDELNAPVTLDLNGRVLVRARAEGGDTTELELARSGCSGPAVRLCVNRRFLARAARLGLPELRVCGPEEPVAGRDGGRTYAFQPLSAGAALAPVEGAVRIESTAGPAATPAVPPRVEVADGRPGPRPRRAATPHGRRDGTRPPASAGASESVAGGPAGLIREAEALHAALGEAKARARRLIAALRRERRRSRLVQSTLATLRQIRLPEPVEL